MTLPTIPLFKVLTSPNAGRMVQEVLASGQVAQGPMVDRFETELGAALGLGHDQLVTVNSGTSALSLAYELAGIGLGDAVLVSPMTCAATITPLWHLGAHPVWVDVDPKTGLIDVDSVERHLTKDTKAVVGIDWAGTPAWYTGLRKVVPSHIPIIEDAAHSTFATRDGRPIGSYAMEENLFVCWSFQAIKLLHTGDGGALVCPTAELTERARRLRWFGFDRRSSKDFRCAQDLAEAGYKFHMNDIAAAIGLANLRCIDKTVRMRSVANAARYSVEFAALAPRVEVAPFAVGSSYWLYTLLVDDRDSFTAHMKERGIDVSQVHRRNDEHSVFSQCAAAPGSLPGLDYFSAHQISIPVGWWLSHDDVTRVIEGVRSWAQGPS